MITYNVSKSESVSAAVLHALAEFEGVDAKHLPPLFDVIEPDALDALYRRRGEQEAFSGGVSFEFKNVTVEVNGGPQPTVTVSSGTTSRQEHPQETP